MNGGRLIVALVAAQLCAGSVAWAGGHSNNHLLAAMGYERLLMKKFAMGPQVEFGHVNIGGDLDDTANFFDATLGFNWYW